MSPHTGDPSRKTFHLLGYIRTHYALFCIRYYGSYLSHIRLLYSSYKYMDFFHLGFPFSISSVVLNFFLVTYAYTEFLLSHGNVFVDHACKIVYDEVKQSGGRGWYNYNMKYDVEERRISNIYLKVCRRALLTVFLEVGVNGFFRIHLVFECLMLLFLAEIPLVPSYNSRVRDHSA